MSDVTTPSHYLVVVRAADTARVFHSLESASRFTGVHADMLRHYCRVGLLGEALAGADTEPVFDEDALYEIRRIEYFRRQHGVNLRALPLVCDLSREIERLQAELRFLRDR